MSAMTAISMSIHAPVPVPMPMQTAMSPSSAHDSGGMI